MKPKFSIITISYNQGQFLEETFQSIVAQKRDDLEYIVIDGASKDNSVDLIKQYGAHIDYWVSEPDTGAANALNKGFAKATGEWLFYLNSDDIILPQILDKVEKVIAANPEIDIFYGHGFSADENLENRKKVYSDIWDINLFRQRKCLISQQSTFIRGDFYRQKLQFNEGNTTCWDGELLVDAALAGAKFMRYEQHTGVFRLHKDSITVSTTRGKQYFTDRARVDDKIDKACVQKNIGNPYLFKLKRDPVIFTRKVLQKIFKNQ